MSLWQTLRERLRALPPQGETRQTYTPPSGMVVRLLDQLDEAVLVISRNQRVLWANQRVRTLLNLDEDEPLLDRELRDLLAPFPALLAWLERTNAPRPVESQLRIPMGRETRHWRVRLVRLLDGPQAGSRILYIQDVTARHQATESLQQRLRRTRWMSQLLEKAFHPVHRLGIIHEVLELFLHPFDDWRLRGAALYVQHSTYPLFLLMGVAGINREDLREEIPGDQLLLTRPLSDGSLVLREPLPLKAWVLPLRLERERPGFLWLAADAHQPDPTPEQRQLLLQASHLLALFLRSLAALHERLRLSRTFEHDVDGLLIFRLQDHTPVFGNPAVQRLLGRAWDDPDLVRELLAAFPENEDLEQRLRQGQRLEAQYQGQTPQGPVSLRVLAFGLTVPPETEPTYGVLTLQDLTEHQTTIQQLERQSEFIEHLLHLSESMLKGHLRLADVLRRILRTTQEMVGAEGGSLILVDENQAPYAVFTGQDLYPPSEFTAQALQQGLAGWVLKHRTAVLVEDALNDSRWVAGGYQEWRSALSVPIYYGDTPLAVLTLTHTLPHHFRQEHLELLQAAADLMAPALYTARLYEEQYFLTQQLAAARDEAEALHRRERYLVEILNHALEPPLEHLRQEWERLHETFLQTQRPLPDLIMSLWESWQELERLLALLQERETGLDAGAVTTVPITTLLQRLEALLRPLVHLREGDLHTSVEPPDLAVETYEHRLFYVLFRLTYELLHRVERPRLYLQVQQRNEHVVFEIHDRQLQLAVEEHQAAGAETQETADQEGEPSRPLALEDWAPPALLEALQGRLTMREHPAGGVALQLTIPVSLTQPQQALAA